MHSGANLTVSTAEVLWKIPTSCMLFIKVVYSSMKLKNHPQGDSALFPVQCTTGLYVSMKYSSSSNFLAKQIQLDVFKSFGVH